MRFRLAQDNDGHWYVIPTEREEEWSAWCEIDPDDERAWDVPEFARQVGGSYSLVSFIDPVIE